MIVQHVLIPINGRNDCVRQEHICINHHEMGGSNTLNRQVSKKIDGIQTLLILVPHSIPIEIVRSVCIRDSLLDIDGVDYTSVCLVGENVKGDILNLIFCSKHADADGIVPPTEHVGQSIKSGQSIIHSLINHRTIVGM